MTEQLEETKERVRPWQWPGEWVRDEKFWRDVTARAASGVIVVFVGYWAAVWLGYIRQPNALKSAFATTYLLVTLLTIFIIVDRYASLKASRKLAERMNKWLAHLLSLLIMSAFIVLVVFTEYFVLWLIFSFIKTVLGIDQELL
ncbi:hypothetical protein [Pseudarthrobacter sp. H2]|uniref:hypothetical protein n=1 Tax=Pseudarthrobacter sp. H2 TaxID=3418415 RepID=UPI003CEBD306